MRVKLAEQDINLAQEQGRHWGELSTHKYVFDRQAQELSVLSSISKEEFVAHFLDTFFSSNSKRLDLQLTSATHEEEQQEYK